MANSSMIAIITIILYLIHYGILWFVHRYEPDKTKEDMLRFGAEFSFVGMSFFATAIPNKASELFRILDNTSDVRFVAFWTFVISAFFFILDVGSVFFYKRYKDKRNEEEKEEKKKNINRYAHGKQKLKSPTNTKGRIFRLFLGNWRLLLSQCLGIVALGAGLRLI